jgi:hypothetical protein
VRARKLKGRFMGLLDEAQIHLVPVLLGQDRRLFGDLAAQHIELEKTRVIDSPSRHTLEIPCREVRRPRRGGIRRFSASRVSDFPALTDALARGRSCDLSR